MDVQAHSIGRRIGGPDEQTHRRETRPASTVAIVQPYLFPYIGYYQLVNAVDQFVFLDDVNFIKKGYIHRNSILLQGAAHRFTLPVLDVSQNRAIREHRFVPGAGAALLGLISQAYRRHPYFDDTVPLVAEVLTQEDCNVAHVTALSIRRVAEYLGLATRFCFSSQLHVTGFTSAQDRIIGICHCINASRYLNPTNGRDLYRRDDFLQQKIELGFLRSSLPPYEQMGAPRHIASLSILDLLMNCPPARIREMLEDYVVE